MWQMCVCVLGECRYLWVPEVRPWSWSHLTGVTRTNLQSCAKVERALDSWGIPPAPGNHFLRLRVKNTCRSRLWLSKEESQNHVTATYKIKGTDTQLLAVLRNTDRNRATIQNSQRLWHSTAALPLISWLTGDRFWPERLGEEWLPCLQWHQSSKTRHLMNVWWMNNKSHYKT